MDNFSRYLTVRFAAVAGLLLFCVLIRPAGLAFDGGFSYFGDYMTTAVPYSAACILYAFLLWKTAEAVAGSNAGIGLLVVVFRVMALALIGIVITPAALVSRIHEFFGIVLFSLQFGTSIWFTLYRPRDWINMLVMLVELASGLAAFYYLPKSEGLLLQSQALFQLAFGILLVRWTMRIHLTDLPK